MTLNECLLLLFFLMLGHVLADYPLQGDFLSKAKSRYAPLPGVPWYQAMGAHCLIHAGAVMYVTGVWWLGLVEFFLHGIIDDTKCSGDMSFNADQFLHFLCKALYVAILWAVLS